LITKPYIAARFLLPTILVTGSAVYAQERDLTGYQQILEYTQSTEIPASIIDGVPLMQVEATDGAGRYMSSAGSGTFTVVSEDFINKTLTNESDLNQGQSGHAATVANRFYSIDSYITGLNPVFLYESGDFFNNRLLNGEVEDFPGRIASHAYVGIEANESQEVLFQDLMNRYDYAASTGNTLMVSGLNNGGGTSVPTLWGQSYNGLSVGRTNGDHSRGGTLDNFEEFGIAGGRTKPDIVAPDTATSWATGQVASGAAYVYGYADSLGHTIITDNTDLQKAIILAGASKEEFPNWANMSSDATATTPLDPVFGAGELNVFNSHRIIEGGEPVNGVLPLHGWIRETNVGANDVTYSFTIPEEAGNVEINAALCWHRNIIETTETVGFGFFSLTNVIYQPELAIGDLRLELSGGDLTEAIVSDSAVDNVEYLYVPELAPGTYTITISNNDGSDPTDAGFAWRINLGEDSSVTSSTINTAGLELSNLVPGVRYEIWESNDLTEFTLTEQFKATSNTESWTAPTDTGESHFYRIKFWR